MLTEDIFYKIIEDLKDVQEVVLFQEEIWGDETVTPLPQLVAACHHGGVLIGAYRNERLVGFSYGFPGFKNNQSYLISHMTGVLSDYHNLGIGTALKVMQRDWAIKYGYKKIVWTFDPLEARNAYFNLNKLGAYVKTYIPAYYGEMNDKLNKGLPTDRLLAEWDICSKRVTNALEGLLVVNEEAGKYQQLLFTKDKSGIPFPTTDNPVIREKGYLISVPANFQDIKKADFEAAKAWREKSGQILSNAFAKGYKITGILRNGQNLVHSYVIETMQLEAI